MAHASPTNASMGPRPFRRGNLLYAEDKGKNEKSLQWGHVRSDVETLPAKLTRSKQNLASMGPRPFRRGNLRSRRARITAARLLQWGHVRSDVETLCLTGD
jgi:hypothetical protein